MKRPVCDERSYDETKQRYYVEVIETYLCTCRLWTPETARFLAERGDV